MLSKKWNSYNFTQGDNFEHKKTNIRQNSSIFTMNASGNNQIIEIDKSRSASRSFKIKSIII